MTDGLAMKYASRLLTAFAAAVVAPSAIAAAMTADDPRYAIELSGRCTTAFVAERRDPAHCAKKATRVEIVDGQQLLLFVIKDLTVGFAVRAEDAATAQVDDMPVTTARGPTYRKVRRLG